MANLHFQDEFLEAYDKYSDAIFRHCYFRISDRELAKDLMQEAFMRTWQYLTQQKKSLDNIRAFLYRVANNLIVDEVRKKRALSLEEAMEHGFAPSSPDENIKDNIDGKSLFVLLEKLSREYREVVVMRYIDDLSPQEIGEILGVSANVVSVRINRALQKLRTFLPKP